LEEWDFFSLFLFFFFYGAGWVSGKEVAAGVARHVDGVALVGGGASAESGRVGGLACVSGFSGWSISSSYFIYKFYHIKSFRVFIFYLCKCILFL